MKKFIQILIFVLLIISPVFAGNDTTVDTSTEETVRLSLTVRNVVYVGVTNSAISSSIVPTTNLKDIKFKFNQYTKKWRLESAYIYVISFISSKVKVTLTPATLTNSESHSLDYSATVSSMNESSDCKTFSFTSSDTKAQTLVEENGSSDKTVYDETNGEYLKPRVMCWEFDMEIDASKVQPQAKIYTAAFTLTISTVS